MFQNNILLKDYKKNICQGIIRKEGIIKKTDKGFGFLQIKSKKKYFIFSKNMKHVFHGDHVIAKIYIEKDQIIVKPEKLIKSVLNIFIGIIKKKNNYFFIFSKYPFFKESIICDISNNLKKNIKNGDWVIAQLKKHKLQGNKNFRATLIKFITSSTHPLTPWKVILSRYNLECESPKMDFNKINFDKKILRKDLTHLEFITIDNENTKDIDDSIFIKKKMNSISLIIAISDPTAYIDSGSYFDIIASKRLFTNYLPGLNIPMLPKKLSENLCSLHQNCKKPVLACKILIDKKGNISNNISFFLAWIKSRAQLTYENVSNWIEKKGSWIPKEKKISNQINLLYELCCKRIKWRKLNAVVFKNRLEYKFHFSDNKEVKNISLEKRRIAHKMVEEAMIIANISAAKFLSKKIGFGIYNTHDGFSKKNVQYVLKILKNYHIKINAKEISNLAGFCKLRRFLNKLSNFYVDSRIRKYHSFSEMSLYAKPHFGLGLPEYATWTSPIRKYSDMLNHRLLKDIILGNVSKKPDYNIILKIIDKKKRHKAAQRSIENWLYINFLNKSKNKNKIFKAEIFDIFKYGIKARLLENGAYVFIPSIFLHNICKELIFDQKNGIIYMKGKEIYRISDFISVNLIDFKLNLKNIIAKPILIV